MNGFTHFPSVLKNTKNMITNRWTLTLALLILGIGVSSAQISKIKRASQLMDNLDYTEAIVVFNQILEKEDSEEAKFKIAECYQKVNDSENAEYWYAQVVKIPTSKPIHKLYYGQALQKNGKCDLARDWYEQYVTAVPEDTRGQFLVKACDYEEELMTKNGDIYEVEHMPFNSNLDDFSPAYNDGEIIFASEREKGSIVKRTHAWTGNPFTELFKVSAKPINKEEGCGYFEYGSAKKFSDNINSKFHDAAVTFSNGGKTIYFTRNNFSEGKVGKSDDGTVMLKVYSAKTIDDGANWTDLESLPFNSDEYSVAHPTLSKDGNTLYFASDMPGGYGGMDVYYSEKESGSWGPPLNLGPEINTEGNEVFPYFHQDEKLYFCSDGQIGLGGLDIYYVEKKEEGEWGMVENLGAPLNSRSDDFGVVFNEEGTCGHFSSDREGGAGRDDIYGFRKIATPVEILVYDAKTKEPIEGATVFDSCKEMEYTTDEDGKINFDMKMNLCCDFTASFEGYLENAQEGCTKDIILGDKVFVEIPLEREMQFTVEGIVFDQLTGLPLENAVVTLTNDCGDEMQTLTTDDSGQYTFELIEECCYTVKGTKEKYLADKAIDQCTKGLTEATVLQVNLNLLPTEAGLSEPSDAVAVGPRFDPDKGIYLNPDGTPTDGTIGGQEYKNGIPQDDFIPTTGSDGSLSFLLHIYYDFNQSYIRDEETADLNQLLDLMNENPEYVVEVSSHTDSRGSFAYNELLSQRRADSVVRWLTEKGVDRSRLIPMGYGEKVNVNDCRNNIPCSEQEHQLNRRTEFKIVGTVGDVIDISKPKANPRVVPCQGCPF